MKKVAVAVLAVALLVLCVVVPVNANAPEVTHDDTFHFTRQQGSLGGADYEIFMPDSWNGHLVIGVRGYSHDEPAITDTNMHGLGMSFMKSSASKKFAYAWSTYGEGGFCVKAGIIRTHQLTQFVVDNYNVLGKVILIGFSMGGQIALMLAEKYPGQYDGVLDVCGNKDMSTFYNYWNDLWMRPSPNEIRSYLNGPPAYIPPFVTALFTDSNCNGLRNGAPTVMSDVETECDGTPESKPQAYDRLSPTHHAGITIPVISLIARLDFIVPLKQFVEYYDAVDAAGCLEYYRSYTITGPLGVFHCDSNMVAATMAKFPVLMGWVLSGTGPTATPRPAP